MERQIIKINEEKCNGCGLCIPNCPEGAIQVIDGKARLVSDLFCDGLGACIGHCPKGAITIEKRPAEPYDEEKVMENVARQGEGVIEAHLKHLKEHSQDDYLKKALWYLKKNSLMKPEWEKFEGKGQEKCIGGISCPGLRMYDLVAEKKEAVKPELQEADSASELSQWPIQLHLINPQASYFYRADILIVADCVPFALNNFHGKLLRGKKLIIFCPKLDGATNQYIEKLTQLFKTQQIKSITIAHMEVPCCFGAGRIVKAALKQSGLELPVNDITITIRGEIAE